MLVGLATYLYGYRYLPARVERSKHEGSRLSAADRRIIVALIAVMFITVFQSTSYYQLFNVMPIWMQQHVALDVGRFRIPIPWYQSISSFASIVGVPLLFWLWQRQAVRRREPDELAKIGTGACIAAASNLILVAAVLGSGGAPIQPLWPLLYCIGLGIGFLYYWPTLLALVSRAAPAKVNATLMGICFMSLFVSNILIGWIGSFYEKMRPVEFWALHAAIAGSGGLLILFFGRRLSRALRPA
jgi:POT family proton-dependent oligopeptide transporter